MGGLDDVELTLVDSLDGVLAFREWLGRRREYDALGFDTETTGLDVRRDRVRMLQFGDDAHGWSIARDDWLGIARAVFGSWRGRFLMHNASFDRSMMRNSCGIDIPVDRIDDTMVQSRINEPNHSMALKSQAARHVDSAAGGLQVELGRATGWTWATVPLDYGPYWQYAALDPVLTYMLHAHHWPVVTERSPRAYDLEMATLWVVERMQDYGAHVNRPYAATKLREFEDFCAATSRWCEQTYGVKPGSNSSVIAVLEREGYEFPKLTAGGAQALDAEILEGVDHPLARAVLNRRRLQKLASTYLRHYVTEADENDLVHPSINTLGASTSRMSMDSPNLQNLPVRGNNPGVKVVRSCITTRYADPELPDEEWDPVRHGTLLMCDFDQIEMRLLAHLSREPAMLAAFRGADDFFVTLARQVYRDETIGRRDPRRQIVKNAGYANIYGAGIRKFALTAGISEAEAREFMGRWNTLYPGVRTFQELVQRLATERRVQTGVPYVTSPLTGRRFIAQQGKEYALVNYLIQGSAAETFKTKLVELDAAGLGSWMVAPVHDEIILDVPGEHVVDAVHVLRKVMNDDTMYSVPVTASVSFGRNWGSKSEWVDSSAS